MSSNKETETDPTKIERTGTVREVGNKAIWSLSSCKPGTYSIVANLIIIYKKNIYLNMILGFGVDQIRDDCIDTYWQSDGQLPHLVNIQFLKKTLGINPFNIYTPVL